MILNSMPLVPWWVGYELELMAISILAVVGPIRLFFWLNENAPNLGLVRLFRSLR